MSKLLLVTGSKLQSYASLPPWMVLTMVGLPFREAVTVPAVSAMATLVPDFGLENAVPVLYHGRQTVWGPLSIIDYVADLFPEKMIWPKGVSARALARSVAHEVLHSVALARPVPSHLCRTSGWGVAGPPVVSDKERIETLWRYCRRRFGKAGKFLFGRFSAVDAMFAPSILAFDSSAVSICEEARAYMHAVLATDALASWREALLVEQTESARRKIA